MSERRLHIGLDLDGTLVNYNELFLLLAREAALVPPNTVPDKTTIRDHIRQAHGDQCWQSLQVLAYGDRMAQARLFDGVLKTLHHWVASGYVLSIVSHKSQYTHLLGSRGPNLHEHALHCLHLWGVTDFISIERIHFSPTRQAKCLHIARLGCHVFVDDLPEVFADSSFPISTMPILFSPASTVGTSSCTVCQNWREVHAATARLSTKHE